MFHALQANVLSVYLSKVAFVLVEETLTGIMAIVGILLEISVPWS